MEEVRQIAIIEIKGDIVNDDDKWIYDWFGVKATSPRDIKDVLAAIPRGESVDVLINSGGGDVFAGQEIYSVLRSCKTLKIQVQSLAGSAAGVIAMAGYCEISPVAMIMIHNVSMQGASGDYHDMQKNAEILKQMNAALAAAYTQKTGMAEEEILKLMDRETWLTANQCLEYGFADKVIEPAIGQYTNSYNGVWLTDERREQAIREKAERETLKNQLLEDLDLYGV